jgi:hypothetical protein
METNGSRISYLLRLFVHPVFLTESHEVDHLFYALSSKAQSTDVYVSSKCRKTLSKAGQALQKCSVYLVDWSAMSFLPSTCLCAPVAHPEVLRLICMTWLALENVNSIHCQHSDTHTPWIEIIQWICLTKTHTHHQQNWIKSKEVAKDRSKRVVVLQLDVRVARVLLSLAIISCLSFGFAGWSYYNSGTIVFAEKLTEDQQWRLQSIAPKEWSSADVLSWATLVGLNAFRRGFRRSVRMCVTRKCCRDDILDVCIRVTYCHSHNN